jgi:hypothetical protein
LLWSVQVLRWSGDDDLGGGEVTDDLEPGKQPGAPPDLESRYRAYLAALNERRLDDLVEHVHDELTYNGEPMTRRQYH